MTVGREGVFTTFPSLRLQGLSYAPLPTAHTHFGTRSPFRSTTVWQRGLKLLGQAQEPCAARGSKGSRAQVVLDPLEPLFELCRRFRELRGDELLVEQAADVGDQRLVRA